VTAAAGPGAATSAAPPVRSVTVASAGPRAAAVARAPRGASRDSPGRRRHRCRGDSVRPDRPRRGASSLSLRLRHGPASSRRPIRIAERRHGRASHDRPGDERRGRNLRGHRSGAGSPGQLHDPRGNGFARTRAGDRKPQQQAGRGDRGRGCPHGRACSVEQLAHRPAAYTKRCRDLLVRASLELSQDEGVALPRWELLHRGQHRTQLFAPLQLQLGPLVRRASLVQLLVSKSVVAQGVVRRVVSDPVEPRPQEQGPFVSVHRVVRLHECLLHDVLGPLASDQRGAVAEQRSPVARHDRLERRLAPRAGQVDQPLVALRCEQSRARQPRGREQLP
jgi:hypothetical protein